MSPVPRTATAEAIAAIWHNRYRHKISLPGAYHELEALGLTKEEAKNWLEHQRAPAWLQPKKESTS